MPGRVLITRPIPEPAPSLLARAADLVVVSDEDRPLTVDELDHEVRGFDAVLCMLHDPIDSRVLESANGCRVFANMAVGYNNIDVAEATRLGILVTNTPGVLTEATADLAWALILAVPRRVADGDRVMRAGKFPGWGPNYLLGGDVTGATLGLVGPGRIALAVAERAAGFKMPLLYMGRRESRSLEALGARRVELDQLLRESDFVSLHVPLTAETTHLIDARALALMKPTSYLINTSRGPVVDEAALVKALKSGTIAGAGWTSTSASPPWRTAWPTARTRCSCPTSAARRSRPGRGCRGWRPRTSSRCSRADGRPTWSIPTPGASWPTHRPCRERRADPPASSEIPPNRRGVSSMGQFKFRIPSALPEPRLADLRKSYITGLDRTPSRLSVEIRRDLLLCQRSTTESGRLFAPWPIEGAGSQFIGTATLGERPEPYLLAIELARGKLNDVRNQLSDWKQMGLRVPAELDQVVGEALRAFVQASLGRNDLTASYAAAQKSLALASNASQSLVEAYVGQVLQNRLAAGKLPTQLAIGLDGDISNIPWAGKIVPSFNAAQLHCSWKTLAPTEGKHRWEELDAQLVWATRKKLAIQAGPLIDLRLGRPARLDLALVGRLRLDRGHGGRRGPRRRWPATGARSPLWHLNQPAGLDRHPGDVGGGPDPPDRPLAPGGPPGRPRGAIPGRARPPLGRVDGLEHLPARPAPPGRLPGQGRAGDGRPGPGDRPGLLSSPGSHLRDLLDFSRMLDLYALLNYPLYLSIVMPSGVPPKTPSPTPTSRVEADQWPASPTDAEPGGHRRPLDRPGGGQAVRPLGRLAAARRRQSPTSTPTAA